MRADLFQDRKCIHVKFNKDTHAGFRTELFKYGLSMQEVLDEFAGLVAAGDRRALTIVKAYSEKKLMKQMQGINTRKRDERFSNLEHDTLYDLIENSDVEEKG